MLLTARVLIAFACLASLATFAPLQVAGQEAIEPDFTWEPLDPLSGSTLCFIDRSTPQDEVKRRDWNSPLGGTRSERPCVFVNDPGDYQVTLTVWDFDEQTYTISKVITVRSRAPVADFVYEPLNPTTTDVVRFKDESYDPDGRVVDRTWQSDYIPAARAYQEFVGIRFEQPGQYIVKLTVEDESGLSDTTSRTITVTRSTLFENVDISEEPIPVTPLPLLALAILLAARRR